MIEFLKEHVSQVTSALVPFVLFFLTRVTQPRVKLFRSKRHAFNFLVQQPHLDAAGKILSPTQLLRTESNSVVNVGRLPAKNIEIVFNWIPQHLNIWPSRHYEQKIAPDGRVSLFFDNLAPKDSIGLEMMALNAELPAIVFIRSDEVVASERTMSLQMDHPKWKIALVVWLMLTGAMLNVYAITILIQASPLLANTLATQNLFFILRSNKRLK